MEKKIAEMRRGRRIGRAMLIFAGGFVLYFLVFEYPARKELHAHGISHVTYSRLTPVWAMRRISLHRPQHTLSYLHHFPNLRNFSAVSNADWEGDLRSLRGLRFCRKLESVVISDVRVPGLYEIGRLPRLKRITLTRSYVGDMRSLDRNGDPTRIWPMIEEIKILDHDGGGKTWKSEDREWLRIDSDGDVVERKSLR